MSKPHLAALAASAFVLALAGCSSPSAPSTAQVRNLSRPGAADFYVGEKFEVVVTGSPDRVVTGSASQNSEQPASGRRGRTDKNGRFSLTGSMQTEHIGVWREQWEVDGVKAAPFTFEVKPAPAQ